MQVLSASIESNMQSGMWIRRMFELGISLKQKHGVDAVCDFSLGNPDLAPPKEVATALRELADLASQPFSFGYMPNAGFPWAREMLAAQLSKEQNYPVEATDVLLSSGAAGSLNALMRSILDPGDEVIAILPYFMEYYFYVDNFGGKLVTVKSNEDFSLNFEALEKSITKKTRAVFITSPSNPSGYIYSKEELSTISELLRKKTAEYNRPIFLVVDEPYRFLAYDGAEVCSVLPLYEYSVVIGSFSKNLCLPGERIGYLALSKDLPDKAKLMSGVTMANRILGYVNCPVVGQHILKHALGKTVDVNVYARRRKLMGSILADAGYDFVMPKGAFYFFPKAPGGDDLAFVEKLTEELILAVPGRGFGQPGYFRLAFCVNEEVIERARGGLTRALKAFK